MVLREVEFLADLLRGLTLEEVRSIGRPPRQPSRSFFSAVVRQGRRPALKQGRIEGSDFQKPIDFSGETANQQSLPGANNCLLAGPQRVGTHAPISNSSVASLT